MLTSIEALTQPGAMIPDPAHPLPTDYTRFGRIRRAIRYTNFGGTGPLVPTESAPMADFTVLPGNVQVTGNLTVGGSISSSPAILGFYAPPGLDPSGASNSDGAINAALQAASPGQTVELPPNNPGAHYSLIAPLVVPSQVAIGASRKVATGHLAATTYGVVLAPVSGFAQGTAPTNSVISFADSTISQGVYNLMIDGSALGSPPDGIASKGAAEAVDIDGVIIYKTNNGINQITGTGSPANCDGWNVRNVLTQSVAGVGIIENGFDLYFENVHAQNSHGDNWQVFSRHNQHVGCRGDVSATGYGVRWAAPYSSTSNDHGGQWFGGGTQFNALGGMITDPALAAPVMVVGASLDGDGTAAGPQAGFVHSGGYVSGWWDVLATGGFPLYGLATVVGGAATGLDTDGGMWNAVTGPVNDLQGLAQSITIGPRTRYSSANGVAIGSSFTSRFSTVTTNGITAVPVTNIWITGSSRILLSWISGTPVGIPYVASRAAGSFTVKSTSASDTATTAAWMVLSQ